MDVPVPATKPRVRASFPDLGRNRTEAFRAYEATERILVPAKALGPGFCSGFPASLQDNCKCLFAHVQYSSHFVTKFHPARRNGVPDPFKFKRVHR